MTFEEGLRVVKVRAESMAAAAKVGAHGMLSIVGLDDATVEECLKEALAKSPEGCAAVGDACTHGCLALRAPMTARGSSDAGTPTGEREPGVACLGIS